MKTHNDYEQQKVTGGAQKVILNEKETAETDELDPKFEGQHRTPEDQYNSQASNQFQSGIDQNVKQKDTDISDQKA